MPLSSPPAATTAATTAARPYRLDEQVGYLLRLATQRHAHILQTHVPHDLTPTQFAALLRLAQLGTCSQNELGRQIAVDAATIKGVVDRLRRKGFIATHPDPDDKRRLMLSLEQGLDDMIAELHAIGFHITEATLEPLAPSERAEFVRLLTKAAFAEP